MKWIGHLDKLGVNDTLVHLSCQAWCWRELRPLNKPYSKRIEQRTIAMKIPDFYTTAHLVVAAIRVLTHQKSIPPSIEAACDMLGISREKGHHIVRRLADMGIVEIVSGAYGTKLFIKDHLAVEEISRDESDTRLDEEVKKFKDGQKNFSKKIESFKAEQEEKKRKLFADLEKKLQKGKDPS